MLHAVLSIAALLSCAHAQTIADLAIGNADLTTLVSALQTTGLVSVLNGTDSYTVLAPTDTAFSMITVPSDPAVLTEVLLNHVINGAVQSNMLSSGMVVSTLNDKGNGTVTVLIDSDVFFYDSMGRKAMVTVANIVASNGVIHIIDMVLLPGGTINDITGNVASLSSLDGALAATGLNATLAGTGPYTLFAPSNDAVAAFTNSITSGVLTYHVVSAEYLAAGVPTVATELTTVQGAKITVMRDAGTGAVTVTDAMGSVATVTTANIAGTNGVVHIIDTVLEYRTIVDFAVENPDLSVLVGALQSTGLDSTLAGTGPFTVLAPTDTAFGMITVPSDTAVLTEVLLNHVISGTVMSSALTSGLVANTLNDNGNGTVTALIDNGAYFYDSMGRKAMVTVADVVASNGVIHIIDMVLLPGGNVNNIVSNVAPLAGAALATTGLNATLADTSAEFTVFAPSDIAVLAVVANDVAVTSDVLLYHVVAGTFFAADVPTSPTELTTANGDTIMVMRDSSTGAVTVTDSMGGTASVTLANIAGVNGVVHVIDAVLIPEMEMFSSTPMGSTPAPVTPAPTEEESSAFALNAVFALIVGALVSLV